jgi:lysophospholipase L1-like esterase
VAIGRPECWRGSTARFRLTPEWSCCSRAGNDLRRRGGGKAARDANIEQIVARLSARGIQVVMLDNDMLRAVPNEYRQADAQHLTPEGYRLLASWLMPKVALLIGLPPG